MRKPTRRKRFRKVRLFRKGTGEDERGIPNEGWEYVRDVYAHATTAGSSESTRDNVRRGVIVWRVELRFFSGSSHNDRIEWQGRLLEFNGVPYNTETRCRTLQVDAVECEPCQTK